MNAATLADTLEKIAQLLELKGENAFKIRAYRTGAELVQNYPGDIMADAAAGKLKDVKGIGDALAQKLQELAATGKLEYFEKLRGEFPEGIFGLFEINGLGPKKIKALHDQLGIGSVPELLRACQDGSIAKVAGFGAKTVANIVENIKFQEQNAAGHYLFDAALAAEPILEFLKAHPETSQATACGSYRRGKELVRDLDFLVATKNPQAVMDDFVAQPFVASVLAHGAAKSSIRLENGLQVDCRAVSNAEYPFALQYFTGSKEHNIKVRGIALQQGYTLNEYRLSPVGNAPTPPEIPTEQALYRFLGMEWMEPALRENTGEIEAAAEGQLPDLVDWPMLRGTFHCHTTDSDGQHSLREMAGAAQDLGLQYLGISDHSKSSVIANGLSEKRLLAQIGAIRKLNREFGEHFRLFAGSEVDILRDGTLDFSDEILAQLDFCVASVHQSFQLPQAEMTARLILAMQNPHVTMLGHATGRLLMQRDSYALDIPAVIEAAAATGTVIELNCQPKRMELDWRWWRLATEKGVLCSVNTDAHHAGGLQYLAQGIQMARKGWLTRRDVIGCQTRAEMEKWLGMEKGKRKTLRF